MSPSGTDKQARRPGAGGGAPEDSGRGGGPLAVEAASGRQATVARITKETVIELFLDLDGHVSTGQIIEFDRKQLGFFGHMLDSFVTYAGLDFDLRLKMDAHVDMHHGVEDVGLVLGRAISDALGDFSGHNRFGWALAPMDDSLAEAALDACRRPYLSFHVDWPQPRTGDFELCLVEEFFRALAQSAGWTLHLTGRRGNNSHHLAEALFKAAGLAARTALGRRPAGSGAGPLSTKGTL
ncbi:MAG: imidazoleglycerol-phosphate dehydratase [Deltaproteobacteria bacterium]|jgi:imidazoleglycerol-phosphate dehydratase|nr:imidazoleglycerol-phosphate dehydratase [Deltaproteobacteria bacterium]